MVFGVAGMVMPMLVNFGATPFLLRGLGPDAYGLQNLVTLVIGYFAIMDMGLDIAAVKFLAEYHAREDGEAENRLLSTNLQLYVVVGLAGMFLLMSSTEFLATRVFQIPADLRLEAIIVFRLGALGFLANMLVAWGGSIPLGLQRYDITNSISIVSSSTGVCVGLAAVYAGYGVVGFVLVKIVATLMAGITYFFMARRLLPGLRLRFGIDREMLRRVGGVTAYGVALRISGILTTGIDRTLIGAWLGTGAVTLYVVPNLVAMSLGQLIARMMSFLFPMASELSSTGQYEALRDILRRAFRFVAAISTAVFIPVFVLADRFLALWVGPEIAFQSTGAFRLLLAASYLSSFAILAGTMVPGLGFFGRFTVYALGKSLVIGLGCALLIQPLGIIGAGIGVLLGGVVDVAFTLFSFQRYLQMGWIRLVYEAYLPSATLGALMAGLTLLSRPFVVSWLGMGLTLGAAGLLFLAIGYAVGIFGETEKRALLAMISTMSRVVTRSQPQDILK